MAVTKEILARPWKSAMHCFGMVPKSTASRTRSCIFLRHTKLKIMMFMCFPTESLQVQTRIVKMPAA